MFSITDSLLRQRFGRLVVISFAGYKKSKACWNCICDCGIEKEAYANDLKRGLVKSCGCLKLETLRNRKLDQSIAASHYVFSSYSWRAKKKGIPFDLTREEAITLFRGNCAYCGVEPKQISRTKKYNGNFIYNGIDRVDSSKGYTVSNCVSCCGMCNKAKNKYSKEEFLEWVKRVYEHSAKEYRLRPI